MDEYNMEVQTDWMRGMKYVPYASTVSKLFQEVPKPGGITELVSTLPLLNLFPLHCKLPGIKGMKFSRGTFGSSIKAEPQNLDFITYDPYCYEVDTNKYDSLYDKHLKNYFKSENICKFLRKIGVLDEKNQPLCSLKDINAYRFYLGRIHKDAVKREFNRLLDEKMEKNQWKTAQIGTIKDYFRQRNREEALNLTREQREQIIKEKRTKRLRIIENIKNREKKFAEREERVRVQQILNKELIMRKRNKYDKVLARGRELSKVRPIRTIVKIKKKNAIKEEILKNKKLMHKLKNNYDTERNLFNKTLAQINNINWLNEVAAVLERSRQLKIKKRDMKERQRNQKLNDRMMCTKMKGLVTDTKNVEGSLLAIKDEEPINEGIGYIVSELHRMDRSEPQEELGGTYLDSEKDVLRKVARQMIKRAAYLNIKHLCQHFVIIMVNCFFETLTVNINGKLPSFEETSNFLLKHSLSDTPLTQETSMICSTYTRYLGEPFTTTHLRDHLIKKKQLLMTLYRNATSLFELIRGRVLLLLCVGDPFIKMPQLRKKIMDSRKIMTIKDLQNALLKLLATKERNYFFTSELGQIASLFAYAFLLKTRKIINYNNKNIESSSECSLKVSDYSIWEMIKYIFKYMQEEYDNYEEESGTSSADEMVQQLKIKE